MTISNEHRIASPATVRGDAKPEGPSQVRAPEGWLICETSSDDDARLIAAAPDLAALAGSILIYQVEGDDRLWLKFKDCPAVSFDFHSQTAIVLLRIEAERRAAIAKATGGQS